MAFVAVETPKELQENREKVKCNLVTGVAL
jgi:hypothetical protein